MNKLLAYHLVTLVPMMVILYLYIYGVIGSGLFAILFCLYALVYRPIIDYKKLQEKGLVTKDEFIKSFGFIRFRFLHELLFEKQRNWQKEKNGKNFKDLKMKTFSTHCFFFLTSFKKAIQQKKIGLLIFFVSIFGNFLIFFFNFNNSNNEIV